MRKTRAFFARLWTDEGGASATEYAILLSIVVIGTAAAVAAFGGALENVMTEATSCLNVTATGC
jgi:Flp pilus assembly pilin Flp